MDEPIKSEDFCLIKWPVILDIRGLKKTYGDRVIHRDINLQVFRGEILGLMGGSGSGKSTILKCIVGLEKPDAGQILLEGQDLALLKESELAEIRLKIGFVFQSGALFTSMTVEENLNYPLIRHTKKTDSEIDKIVSDRLKRVDLLEEKDLYPAELSGGMQKRVGLARANMLDPKVMFFDEPTAGLDPVNIKNFIKNFRRLHEQKEISGIFITHDISVLYAISDRIAFLQDGLVYAVEPISVVKKSNDPVIRSFIDTSYEEASI